MRARIPAWFPRNSVFVGSIVLAISSVPFPVDAKIAVNLPGSSNVLFLPGIEGSRLYRPDYNGGTDKLWEPSSNADVRDLYLNPDGTSIRHDVYTKEGDVIDELPTGENIYKSLIDKLNELKTNGVIVDWEPIAYDWRLSLDDILAYGNDVQGRIYYSGDLRATSTPYIIQELKRLAATSRTGKVTIIAHSNGGLLAKRLTEILGPAESARLIDRMIFVAVPQEGTPAAIPVALHGYGQDILFGLVTAKSTARTFASTSPMTYALLPSAQYFTSVDDPVVKFDASLPDWIARYGDVVHSQYRLHQFLTDMFGKVDSQAGDTNQPIQLQATLLSNAETLHSDLDNWTPPAGVRLEQIAGWGVPKTISGITYVKKGAGVAPEANFTIDGDGTVVIPSALGTRVATGTVNYWMDLKHYNNDHWITTLGGSGGLASFDHSRILETDTVINFISDTLENFYPPLSDYEYLSTTAPANSSLRLRYALHSPLTLNLYDGQGHHTGISTSTGHIEEQIPGTYYTEFGDVKSIFTDASTTARIVMNGYAPGTFTFNVDEYSGDMRTASTTFKDIPTTANTNVSLSIDSDITTLSPMRIDTNGDGSTDVTLVPKLNGVVTLDTTPPEFQISFSTTTDSVVIVGTDDSGVPVVSSTTIDRISHRDQEEGERRAKMASTVTATDESGNTTVFSYVMQQSASERHALIVPKTVAYNGATTTLARASISYSWSLTKNKSLSTFIATLHTASTTLVADYRAKENKTSIVTHVYGTGNLKEEDDSNMRSRKQTFSGLVIPYMKTSEGNLIISY